MASPNPNFGAQLAYGSQRLSQVQQESVPGPSNRGQHKPQVQGDEQVLQTSNSYGSSLPSIHYVHMLERDLDAARRKIQECEATIIHQAHLIRQSPRLKTLHGIVCPDCNQEVPHTCTPLPRMSTTASAKQDENFRTIDAVDAPAAKSTPTINRYRPRSVLQQLWASTNLRFHFPIASTSGTAHSPAEVSTPNPEPNQPIVVHASRQPTSAPTRYSGMTTDQTDESDNKVPQRTASSSQSPSLAAIPLLSISNSASDHPISTSPNNALSFRSNKPDWSIKYNPEVGRVVDVDLIRTIDVKSAFRVKFSPDGQLLAVAPVSWEYPVYIFNVSTGARVCVLEDLYLRETPPGTVDLCFSPDGKYLAASMRPENLIKIWEVGKKHVRNAFKGHLDWVHAVVFSVNGRLLLSGSYDRTVRIWNMRDGSSQIFRKEEYHFCSICSSSDGKYVAAGTFGKAHILIWELRSGNLVALVEGHSSVIENISFMPNSNGLITGGWDGTLKYWDIVSSGTPNGKQREVLTLVGHTAGVRSISISPDGQWLISGSIDKTVIIWNINTWTQHCILRGHEGEVVSVEFSPAGGYFASANSQGTVRIWSYKLV